MSRRITVLVVAVLAVSSTGWLSGQAAQTFQFLVSATNSAGELVTDLKPEEVVFAEKAGKATVTKVEPFALPVKVTIAVDNGEESALALPNYRNGLKGFVEAFPANTEMTVITTSPQPRMVVRPTTDRTQILRGVNGFAPGGAPALHRHARGVQPATAEGGQGFEGRSLRADYADGVHGGE